MTMRLFSLVFAALLGLSACAASGLSSSTAFDPEASDPATLASLDAAAAAWRADGPARYRLRYFQTCFCPSSGPMEVTVHDGRVVRADGGVAAYALTVDDLFAQARALLAERDSILAGGGRLDVRLSRTTPRLPIHISADPYPSMVDDESAVEILGFEADE